MLVPILLNTLGVIGVGSPGARGGGGDRRRPPTPFRAVFAPPQPPPDNRSTAPGNVGQGMATEGVGAITGARWTVSPRTPGRRFACTFLPRRAPMDDWSMSRTDWREMAAMAGSSTSRGKGKLFKPFPAVSQLLPIMQIHFRSHADIYTHFISSSDKHFKTFWTVPGTFPSTSGS